MISPSPPGYGTQGTARAPPGAVLSSHTPPGVWRIAVAWSDSAATPA